MIYALGIGSNSNSRFGNKLNTLKFVLKELERNNIKVIKKSKLYSSPPKNFKTAAETFLNAALVVETKLKPKNLLIILKKIERITGRYATLDCSLKDCEKNRNDLCLSVASATQNPTQIDKKSIKNM